MIVYTPTTGLVRHGESEGNVGATTWSAASIRLTPRGHDQARTLATSFIEPPDLIVVSPYLRTQQTAAPLIQRFPGIAVEEWPVHEFTYLNAWVHTGTTEQQRAVHAQAYWARCDPDWREGEGAESFADFVCRIVWLRQRLQARPDLRTLVFTHGYFIKGFQYRLQHLGAPVDSALMAGYRDTRRSGLATNTQVVPVHV
jgi:broad specificity phosphatase PhoE